MAHCTWALRPNGITEQEHLWGQSNNRKWFARLAPFSQWNCTNRRGGGGPETENMCTLADLQVDGLCGAFSSASQWARKIERLVSWGKKTEDPGLGAATVWCAGQQTEQRERDLARQMKVHNGGGLNWVWFIRANPNSLSLLLCLILRFLPTLKKYNF